jgi:glutaminase
LLQLTNININKLSTWVEQAKTQTSQGKIIQRIPLLAKANPNWFAVHIYCNSDINHSLGDTACIFPLMSVIKPFAFLYLLENLGTEKVLQIVDTKPSKMPFNSLEQLISDNGHPRNPMINSGAITVADKLLDIDSIDKNYCTQSFFQWLNKLAGSEIYLDLEMLACVRATRSQVNVAIAQYLYQHGKITNIDSALDIYEQICCISGTVEDLAKLGKLLACKSGLINAQNRQIVNDVMLTCGLYEASPHYADKIGLPMKSGISGALITIVPGQGAIATYSPALDNTGNSISGLYFIQNLSSNFI